MSREKKTMTKAGAPRKRAPGAGRPSAGRTYGLPRIKPAAAAILREIAQVRGQQTGKACSMAEAIELAACLAIDAMEGRPIDPALMRYP